MTDNDGDPPASERASSTSMPSRELTSSVSVLTRKEEAAPPPPVDAPTVDATSRPRLFSVFLFVAEPFLEGRVNGKWNKL